jgi:hypothetical protein
MFRNALAWSRSARGASVTAGLSSVGPPPTFRMSQVFAIFGGGIHYCVGAPLARIEAPIALGELARRLARAAAVVTSSGSGLTGVILAVAQCRAGVALSRRSSGSPSSGRCPGLIIGLRHQ